MTKVVLSGYIIVPNNELEIIKKELIEHTQLTRREPGCIVFEVTPNSDDSNRYDVYEEFVDQNSFERHQARVKNSRWGSVTSNVLRHYTITEIE